MVTECIPDLFGFAPVEGRKVMAAFDGGKMTSDAGAMLLGATNRTINLVGRFAGCFEDHRAAELIEHEVRTLVGQRVYGIALGYEDLIDHDELRRDPVMAVRAGKLAVRRSDGAPLAGKSTLNRLELSRPAPTRYHKISDDGAAIERLLVDFFLEAHSQTPPHIILDLDATDDPLHGHPEGRFFHGYYDCYCYLPLYVFCGRHLLAAKLRPANIDGSAGAIEEMGAHCRPDPPALAHRAYLAAGRFGLCTRGADGVVRKQRSRLSVRPRPQHPAGRRDRGRTRDCRRAEPEERHAGAALQGLHLDNARQLEPRAPGGCQGRMDRWRGQSPVRCHLSLTRGARGPASLREALLRPRRHGKPH